jgi:transposase
MQPSFVRISIVLERVKRGAVQATGRSRGGLTTKIHAIVDALSNPVAFSLTVGQVHHPKQSEVMLEKIEPNALLANKAYDANALIEALEKRQITPNHSLKIKQERTKKH